MKCVFDAETDRAVLDTASGKLTKAEFDAALVTLQKSGKFEYPIDLGLAWKGEWYSYAFGPFLQSHGGDLLNVSVPKSNGVLNGPAGVEFGNWWQSLFTRKLTPGTSQDGADRETGFLDGKYAMQWNGNWAALGALKAFPDTVFLPSPDFGKGPKIGAASWQFGVSAKSAHPEGAGRVPRVAGRDEPVRAGEGGRRHVAVKRPPPVRLADVELDPGPAGAPAREPDGGRGGGRPPTRHPGAALPLRPRDAVPGLPRHLHVDAGGGHGVDRGVGPAAGPGHGVVGRGAL